jgi:hypothetical protein
MGGTPKVPDLHSDFDARVISPTGRATKYAGAADDTRAYGLALLGYIGAEIAADMGISPSTLYNWKRKYPQFAAAIASGGKRANFRVVNALLSRAEGGYVTETKALKLRDKHGNERIEIAEVQRYIQPDTQAIIFWLTNREREHWKIYKPVEHTRRRLLLRTYRRRVEKLLKRCIRFCTS